MEFTFSAERLLIQTNFAPIVSVLVLIAFIKTNRSFTDRINRNFLIACTASILLTASDNMRFISARLAEPTIYRYISAGFGYTFRSVILYLLMCISGRHQKHRNKIYSIPLILCILFSVISIFPFGRGIVFSFSDQNKFIRGPLGFIPHIVCFFYAFFIIFYSIKNYRYNKFETLIVIITEFFAIIAMLMENRFKFDFVLSQILIYSIIFYYFFILTQTYKRDTLTHLLNRRCFYLEINHRLKNPMIMLSMDLNNLKVLNDTQGHAAGDRALITVTDAMRKHFSKFGQLYRTGGDEFMAVFLKIDMQTAEELVKEFQNDLSQTEYQVACGLAQYTPGDNIDKIITLSDEKMYSNKTKIKNEKNL